MSQWSEMGSDLVSFLTVHELKQLVDDSLQEFPVCSEEARILAHNVHDVGRYDGLVVLPSFLLTQAQQVLHVRGCNQYLD